MRFPPSLSLSLHICRHIDIFIMITIYIRVYNIKQIMIIRSPPLISGFVSSVAGEGGTLMHICHPCPLGVPVFVTHGGLKPLPNLHDLARGG